MKKFIALIVLLFFLMPSIGRNAIIEKMGDEILVLKTNIQFEKDIAYMPGMNAIEYARGVCILPFNISIKKMEIKFYGNEKASSFNYVPPLHLNNRVIRVHPYIPEYSYKIGKGLYKGRRVTIVVIDAFRFIPKNATIKIYYRETENFHNKYDMLIITPSIFYNQSIKLATFKEEHGIKCKVSKLDMIYATTNGRDDAEKIKRYIKNEIEKDGIKYVLLFGGVNLVPARYSNLDIVGGPFISDLYFADIYDANGSFSSWDSNNNGIYGEGDYRGLIDAVDLYPDVYVGRLACENEEEANSIVNKMILYETIDKPWFKNLLLVGGDTHPWWKDVMASGLRGISFEGEETCNSIANYLHDFNAIKLYARNFNNKLTDENIIKYLNSGVGFAVFSGHGLPDKWMTHPPWRTYKWVPEGGFSLKDLKLLEENDMTIYTFDACLCGKIDEKCIAWEIVKRAGVAAVALTTYGLLIPGEKGKENLNGLMTPLIFKNYYNSSSLGEMFYDAIVDYLNDIPYMPGVKPVNYLTPEEWILLGDPSMGIKCSS